MAKLLLSMNLPHCHTSDHLDQQIKQSLNPMNLPHCHTSDHLDQQIKQSLNRVQ
jgi:hypothetical protein